MLALGGGAGYAGPVSNLLLVAICLLGGVALRRAGLFPADGHRALNAWVLYVALPALVLAKMGGVRLDAHVIVPASMAWLQVAFVAAVVAGLGRLAGWDRPTRAALTLTAGLGNTSFLGLPLVEALIGPQAIPTAILCDQLGSFLVFSTIGLSVAAWAAGERLDAGAIVGRIVRFPAVWALVIALTVPLPSMLVETFDRIGATLTPLAVASVGVQVDLSRRSPAGPLAAGLALKLLAVPAVLWALYRGVGVAPSETLTVTVIEAAMAPMITAGILASERGLAPDLVARMVSLGIPLSLVTVPAWAWWLSR